jgi:hypothetical protein
MNNKSTLSLQKTNYLFLLFFFIAVSIVLLANYELTSAKFATFTTIFLGIFIEAVPFLILGTMASGIVEVFFDQSVLKKYMPASPFLNAILGSLMGLLFPVCECGVVPLVRRLLRKGLSVPAGVSFLLAAPVINPIVIMSTASAFGFSDILYYRIGLTLFVAITTGIVFAAVKTPWEVLRPTQWITNTKEEEICDCGTCHIHSQEEIGIWQKMKSVFLITADEFFEIGRFLIVGSLVAAGMQTLIPQNFLFQIGQGPVVSVLVMIGTAIILSICSTVDSFVALGFSSIFNQGAILGFLVFGPMVDIKSVMMFSRVFKPKALVYLIVIPFLLVLMTTIILNIHIF